jgi:transposase-like protein
VDRKKFEEMLGRVAKLNLSQRKRMFLALSDTAEGRVEGVGTPSVNSAGHGPDKTSDDTVMTKSGARTSEGAVGELVLEAGRRRVDNLGCPYCTSREFVSWGRANALQRFRCKNCGRTFNALTNTPLARLRKKEQWLEHAGAMIDGSTITKSAERCNVNYTTAFRWRHRFRASLSSDERDTPKGSLEGDAPQILESIIEGRGVQPTELVPGEKEQGDQQEPTRRTSSGHRRSRPQGFDS